MFAASESGHHVISRHLLSPHLTATAQTTIMSISALRLTGRLHRSHMRGCTSNAPPKTLPTTPGSAEHCLARNVTAIVSLKSTGRPRTPESRRFVESQPPTLRKKLLQWGIIDANTNASFEPLMIHERIPAKHSKLKTYDITGGHLFGWEKRLEDNERTPRHVSESVARVARTIEGCGFVTPSDIDGEKLKNWFLTSRTGITTVNGYLSRFKSFVRWMLETVDGGAKMSHLAGG